MTENRAFQFGMASIGIFLISIILAIFNIASDRIGSAVALATVVFAVGAIINGRKELAKDSKDKKAKIGLILGIVMIALQLLPLIFLVFI